MNPPSLAQTEIDPELVALPRPPAGPRYATWLAMAVVMGVALATAASLRHDAAYFFASETAVVVGDVRSVRPGDLRSNVFQTVSGTPTLANALTYRRVVTGEEFVVFPLAGQRTVFVHMRQSDARTPRSEFSGRLVTFGDLGLRMDGIVEHFSDRMGMPVSSESFVLLVDETPGSYLWALVLVGLCFVVVLVNVLLLFRWFAARPLPD